MPPKNGTAPRRKGQGKAATQQQPAPSTPSPEASKEICYSRGTSKHDAWPDQRVAESFAAFRDKVLSDRSKAKGKTYICAPFRANGDGRHHRCKVDALPRSFLPLDLDRIESADTWFALREQLNVYSGFAYETFSSTPDAPRARVLLEQSRATDREEGDKVCQAFQRRIELPFPADVFKFDVSVYKAEQPLFTPPVDAQTFLFNGAPVDVDELLAEVPPEKPRQKIAVAISGKLQRYTLGQAKAMLKHVSADDRTKWRYIGIILGREYFRRSDAWDAYCEWSNTWSGKKKSGHDQIMHEAFHKLSQETAQGSELTMGTLVQWALEGGWEPQREAELENFYYILPSAKYLYTPSGALWVQEAVNVSQPPIIIKKEDGKEVRIPAARWIAQTRRIESVVFDPSAPHVIDDWVAREQGMVPQVGARALNTYYAPTLKLGNANEAMPYVNHVHKLYPDKAIANHILDFLAHRVQHPGDKVRHALVLGGEPGVGKDTIIDAMIPAIGQWNVGEVDPPDLFTPYDDFKPKVLIRISEVCDLHDVSKFKFYEATKNLIAGTPDWTTVNPKYGVKYCVRNVAGVVMTTNYISVGLYLPANDRRHYIAETAHSSELWKTTEERERYFVELWEWLYDGGFSHIAAYLNERDIKHFDPNAVPSKTEAFFNLASSSAVSDGWLIDALAEMGDPDVVRADALRKMIQGMEDKEITRSLAPALQRLGYGISRDPKNNKDGRRMFVDKSPHGDIVRRTMVYVRREISVGLTPAELEARIAALVGKS